ncbi:MAG: agmatinase family protein [Planctomycetota bacterium]
MSRNTPHASLIISALMFVASVTIFVNAQSDEKAKPKTLIEQLRENPRGTVHDESDPTTDLMALFRDPNDNPKREPGPINIQKTAGGPAHWGIPTFFRQPVALSPEDLKAGKVEVAFMGASVDLSTGMRGAQYAPQAVRAGWKRGFWGSLTPQGHPVAGAVDFLRVLRCVDYGDAPVDLFSNVRSALPVHKMVKEICEAGAIPVVVGGDHSLMYPDLVAVTDVYGKGKVGVVHFDAHHDASGVVFGNPVSHGAPVRRLIDEGHVKGRNFVQIGLNGAKPGAKDMAWMRKNQVRYHFMSELDRDGWKKVLERALAEAMDGPEYLFISVDTDCLDPAWAPGMGTPAIGGMSPRELFPMLRALAIQQQVVGVELVEVNPIVDPTYRSVMVANFILREILTASRCASRASRTPTTLPRTGKTTECRWERAKSSAANLALGPRPCVGAKQFRVRHARA